MSLTVTVLLRMAPACRAVCDMSKGAVAWRDHTLARLSWQKSLSSSAIRCAKPLKRNILQFIGIKPVRSTIYGMIEAAGDERRKTWWHEVELLGRATG